MTGGFRVEGGSAARDAEQRNRESGGVVPKRSVGIRVGGQVGRKFEIDSPRPAAPIPVEEPKSTPAPPSAAARLWSKFRSLFGSK
jgi:hypothetical protein